MISTAITAAAAQAPVCRRDDVGAACALGAPGVAAGVEDPAGPPGGTGAVLPSPTMVALGPGGTGGGGLGGSGTGVRNASGGWYDGGVYAG